MRARINPERRARTAARHEGWSKGKVRPLDIRAGDTVVVIAGKDKGKRGVVDRTIPVEQRIVVRGVNLLKRHTKAGVKGNMQGGIVDFDAPVAYSNVMLVCPNCDKPTRIGHQRLEDGTPAIVCRKCGELYERPRA
ncbi:MAG TPA: 50S ribosomal protein L24 [Candidatus Sulfotelmatobacter sp.]|jgi:large subunit ribosomal protein L24|nr:50S ribosomal protein L24 [Candidatus Sulfotelmatobacter sp.]